MECNDKKYEQACLNLAKKALASGEVPVGAVVVKDGKIIARAYNRKETTKVALYHAEIVAIIKACKKLKKWRLEDCDLYVTLQPCDMCMGAIIEARIRKVIYFMEDDCKVKNLRLDIKQAANRDTSNEYEKILKTFFKKVRNR